MKKIILVSLASLSVAAHAAGEVQSGSILNQVTSAVDIGSLATFAGGLGVVIIGLAMGEKGVSVAKRWIRKA
jgi:putative copper export protein